MQLSSKFTVGEVDYGVMIFHRENPPVKPEEKVE